MIYLHNFLWLFSAAPAAGFLAVIIPLWLRKPFLVRSKIAYKHSYHINHNCFSQNENNFQLRTC